MGHRLRAQSHVLHRGWNILMKLFSNPCALSPVKQVAYLRIVYFKSMGLMGP